MTTSEEVFQDEMAQPLDVFAELTERTIARRAEDISPEITNAQLSEVRRRIAQVESGEVALIPGDEASARVRHLLAENDDEGVAEALRRDAEIDADPASAVSWPEVDSQIQARGV